MVRITPYLGVPRAIDAIEEYKKVLNANLAGREKVSEEVAKQWGLPENFDFDNSTMHAVLKIGDAVLYLADNLNKPDEKEPNNNVDILIHFDDEKSIKETYSNAEKAGWQIAMPLKKEFFADLFGMVKDPYGISWQLYLGDSDVE